MSDTSNSTSGELSFWKSSGRGTGSSVVYSFSVCVVSGILLDGCVNVLEEYLTEYL